MAILNREHLADITGGDESIDAEMYQLFIDSTDEYLENLKNASSLEEKKKAAHALKGSAANIGAEDLSAACKKAEGEIEGDWEGAVKNIFLLYKETLCQMLDIIRSAQG